MILKSVAIWFVLVVLAIANGATRNALITPRFGEQAGHVASTIILCALIFLVTLISIGWTGPENARSALLIGVLWVVLTVAFEFIAGHYVFGNPWEKLLADYNILRGRVWLLVLVATFLSPVLAAKVKGIF
jgi:hypothetical protein